jgi:hypothetical protein
MILLLSLKSFVAENRHVAMQKLFMKKDEERKNIRKNGQCSKYLKQWVLRCPSKKRREKEMNKIAHVFLQSCF